MKIYLIRKPGTDEIYIGQTKLKLKLRLQLHFIEQKRSLHREIYKWLDETCIIELLEEFDSDKQDTTKEMLYVQEYISNGFSVKNTCLGKYTLNPETYIKAKNAKHNTKHNTNRHPDYISWQSKIAYQAKKLKLSSKEYRIRYNIPDYNGPKKLI